MTGTGGRQGSQAEHWEEPGGGMISGSSGRVQSPFWQPFWGQAVRGDQGQVQASLGQCMSTSSPSVEWGLYLGASGGALKIILMIVIANSDITLTPGILSTSPALTCLIPTEKPLVWALSSPFLHLRKLRHWEVR